MTAVQIIDALYSSVNYRVLQYFRIPYDSFSNNQLGFFLKDVALSNIMEMFERLKIKIAYGAP